METGLYQNCYRFYDPDVGRYISQDPIGLLGGLNVYQYTPNPVEWSDPLGLSPWAWNPNTGMGHHLVPRGKANSAGLELLGTPINTPSFFPTPYEQGMHEELHRAQRPFIGKLQGAWEGTPQELLSASKAGLSNLDYMKGELRIPATGEIIASSVTPSEAFDHLVDWHNQQLAKLAGDKDCDKKKRCPDMRKTFEVITDYNGIVLFDPVLLKGCFDDEIPDGENIFEAFSSTSLGDEVLRNGIVLPILAIDDGGYEINISVNEIFERPGSEIVFTNGIYPLQVASRLIVADLAVFREWYEGEGWIETGVPRGIYSVNLVGFSQHKENIITNCGYDLNLTPTDSLPMLTANLEMSNQVMR